MLDRKSSSWFYPKSTGDPGRDRNARTLQFSCYLLAFAIGGVAILNVIFQGTQENPLLVFAVAGLLAAAVLNRAGRSDWAARTAFLAVLLTAVLLVFEARDGFRSHAMLVFPGLLLISVMLLDRVSYVTTAAIVLVAVAALGIAVKQGLTRATRPVHTSYGSIFFVDLHLLVIAIIGSRIARDTQGNVFELRASIDRLSAANLELVQIREHLQDSEQRLKSAQRLTHVGSWHWNLGANQVVCSEECKRIFGQPEDYAPSLEGLLEIIAPHGRARVAMRSNADCREERVLTDFGSSGRTATCARLRSPAKYCSMKKARHDTSLAPARMSPMIDARKRQPSPVRSWSPWEHWPMELHTTLTTCSAVY
jgi:PAS domain-containing protein